MTGADPHHRCIDPCTLGEECYLAQRVRTLAFACQAIVMSEVAKSVLEEVRQAARALTDARREG